MRKIVLIIALAAAMPLAAHADNAHYGRGRPQQPAHDGFAQDFPRTLFDSEWDTPEQRFPIGGFGGIQAGLAPNHVPVIFVHGNNVDAGDWYPVIDDFKGAYGTGDARAWNDQDLWALSYNGLGGINGTALERENPKSLLEKASMGWDGTTRVTANDVNAGDLYAFIHAVQSYTGSQRFSIVSHSLGVTLARKVLQSHWNEFRSELVAFVGISGANHGTDFCAPGSEEYLESCDEIAAGTRWLADLNVDPDGQVSPNGIVNETYGTGARWTTIRDGSGTLDIAYMGPYTDSPVLAGALNCVFPAKYHNDLRIDPDVVTFYRLFLEAAESNGESPQCQTSLNG